MKFPYGGAPAVACGLGHELRQLSPLCSALLLLPEGRRVLAVEDRAATRRPVGALFLLQEQRRLLAQDWKKAFRCLCQEPRQRQFDVQRVPQHVNAGRRSLSERAHAETQCISFPSLLLDRDHRSEATVGAGEAFFETADGLDLPETMADDDCDGIAHENCNRVASTCMRAIIFEQRSRSKRGGYSCSHKGRTARR